jgi:hypothetical protein
MYGTEPMMAMAAAVAATACFAVARRDEVGDRCDVLRFRQLDDRISSGVQNAIIRTGPT